MDHNDDLGKALRDAWDAMIRRDIENDKLFMLNPADRWLPDIAREQHTEPRTVFGVDPAVPGEDDTVLGMRVVYDDAIEPGTVFFTNIKMPAFDIRIEPDREQKIVDDINDSIQEMMYRAFMVPAEMSPGKYDSVSDLIRPFFKHTTIPADWFAPIHWRQRPGESLVAWGERLNRVGVLDVPDIRYAYQDACLRASTYAIRQVIAWFRERVR